MNIVVKGNPKVPKCTKGKQLIYFKLFKTHITFLCKILKFKHDRIRNISFFNIKLLFKFQL